MKFSLKKFLILLFVCYSPSIICMEHEYPQITPAKKTHKSKKSHKTLDERKIFEKTDYRNNDSFNWNPEKPTLAITNLEEQLKQIRKKSPTRKPNDKHEYRTIVHDKDIPQHCCAMLARIIKQNDTHRDKFSLFLAEKLSYSLLPPSNEDFHLSSPVRYCINIDSRFIKKLSLKAQEAWCLYLVNVAISMSSDFTHKTILSDKTNKELCIALAAQNENYIDLFNTLAIEAREVPIDLYKEIRAINKIYEQRAWLKKYAV